MRRINALYVPIPDEEGTYLKIQFPTVEKTIAELAEINNPEIVASIGTTLDVLPDQKTQHKFNVVDTYMVRSLQVAIDHYGLITQRKR